MLPAVAAVLVLPSPAVCASLCDVLFARRYVVALGLGLLACDNPKLARPPSSSSQAGAETPGAAAPNTAAPKPADSGALHEVPAAQAAGIRLERVHRKLSKPLGLEFFAGDPHKRLFVVEQTGTIRAIEDGVIDSVPLLDISKEISREHSEQGLLGLAFHPDFQGNRRLFVNFTDREGATRVVEYRAADAEPLRVDKSSAKLLLRIDQPWRNHNGGNLEFGPDGGLYVGTGDGGAAADPKRAAQNMSNMLGKMLRIEVDSGTVKVVQSGLRNPWRYSFDSKTGDLYIADVGQDKWEEVDVVASKDIEGANFGWSTWEGLHCFRDKGCSAEGMRAPVLEYDHQTGCSVTGGEVYRGKALPSLDGIYFYSDFCTAIVRSFRWSEGVLSDHWDWKQSLDPEFRLSNVSAFASDQEGELYLLSTDGLIYKLVPGTP